MTEEKQKVNVVRKEIISFFYTLIALIIAFIISIIITGVIINIGQSSVSLIDKCGYYLASDVLQSLQSAAAIYVAEQKVSPEVFSDFVISKGEISGAKTFSLESIDSSSVLGLKTKRMKLTFEPDNWVIYYLNGSEVTASYSFNEGESEKSYIYILLFTAIGFIILRTKLGIKLCTLLFRGSTIVILFLVGGFLLIFLAVAIPRFKPAIYLYPEKPTEVKVILDKNIDLTIDIPKYNYNKGWKVMAYPNGKIVDLQPEYTDCNKLDSNYFGLEYAQEACKQNNYPYLYWEGITRNKPLPLQTKGWLVKMTNIKAFLNLKLDYIGFNKSEKEEFIRYWIHKIGEYKQETVFISFMQTDAVNNDNSLTIIPKPDSLNRFYIIVDLNIENHKNPQPQKLEKFKRTGFTVVDWGGSVISKN